MARTVNEDSQLYNAAKHGATALGGTRSLHFIRAEEGAPPPEFTGEPLPGETLLADGMMLTFLEREGTRKKGTWHHKTQWVLPEQSAYLVQLAIIQMEALWTVARCRYLDEPYPGGEVITGHSLDLMREFVRPAPGLAWRRQIATETIGPPDEPASG